MRMAMILQIVVFANAALIIASVAKIYVKVALIVAKIVIAMKTAYYHAFFHLLTIMVVAIIAAHRKINNLI